MRVGGAVPQVTVFYCGGMSDWGGWPPENGVMLWMRHNRNLVTEVGPTSDTLPATITAEPDGGWRSSLSRILHDQAVFYGNDYQRRARAWDRANRATPDGWASVANMVTLKVKKCPIATK